MSICRLAPSRAQKRVSGDGPLKVMALAARGAIHQLLSIILKLRILVLLPVSTMPYVVIVKNYS
jgi:hypothetical protein